MRAVKNLWPMALLLSAQFVLAQAPVFDRSNAPQRSGSAYSAASGTSAGGNGIVGEANVQVEIYQQLQSLQQEVMELRGIVEEQGHELRTLKQQSLDRYIELDRRIGSGTSGTGSPSSSPAQASAGTSVSASSSSAQTNSAAAVSGDEIEVYRLAYELVKSKDFAKAIIGFDDYLKRFPDGSYAANAWYWTGELQLVSTPRDLNAAEKAFSTLLAKYPDNSKIPDTMYKLGKVYFLQGNKPKSKKMLNDLIAKYGDSNRSAVKFARQFLQDNF